MLHLVELTRGTPGGSEDANLACTVILSVADSCELLDSSVRVSHPAAPRGSRHSQGPNHPTQSHTHSGLQIWRCVRRRGGDRLLRKLNVGVVKERGCTVFGVPLYHTVRV